MSTQFRNPLRKVQRVGLRLRLNRTAADDNALVLMRLAALPLTMPPFPFQRFAEE